MTDSVNAGADDVKRANCGSKLEQWRAMQESGCHVATSPRRDVGSTNTEANNQKRHDVATSRRQHEICTSSFKAPMVQKSGHREAYERGHGIPEQSDTDFEEVPGICTVSHFCWILE